MREDCHSFGGRQRVRGGDAERDIHRRRQFCVDLVDDGRDRVLRSVEQRVEDEICHADAGEGGCSQGIGCWFGFGIGRGCGLRRCFAISSQSHGRRAEGFQELAGGDGGDEIVIAPEIHHFLGEWLEGWVSEEE